MAAAKRMSQRAASFFEAMKERMFERQQRMCYDRGRKRGESVWIGTESRKNCKF